MRKKKLPALDRVLQRLAFLRMFLPLVALSVLAIGTVGFWGEQTLESRQHQRAQFMARIIDRYLDQAARTLDAVARVAKATPSENLAFIQEIWEAYGYFDTLYYLDINSKIRLLVPPDPRYLGLDMSNLPSFKQGGEEKKLIISRPFISLRTGNPTVYLIRKLSQGGLVVGELNLGSLQDEITRERGAPGQGVVFILDQFGMLLAHPASILVKQQTNQSYLEIFQRGLGGDATLVYEYAQTMVLGSAARVERAGWVVVDQVPLSAAYRPYAWALGLTLLASLVIWLALTWNLRRQLQRQVVIPLVQLSRGIGALANGDFSRGKALASIPVAFAELTTLAADFQHMSEVLEARQAALQESEERYRSLFERMPLALFRSTPAGLYLDVNPACVLMLAYPDREALLKVNVADLYLNPQDRERWRAIAERDGVVRDFAMQLQRHDGTVIWVRNTSRAVRDSEGQALYYEGSLEDISERKKLEAQLRQTQKMEAVGQLAGGVAHDFNNMLGVIIGHAELALEMADLDDPLRRHLQEILAAALRSSEITRQLLAFARKQTIAPKILDLNETVEGMLKLLRRLIGEDIDLAWLPGSTPWPVKMDPSQIDQILANLCVNARDAIDGVGKVTIETHKIDFDDSYCAEHKGFHPGAYVMLAVSDNGSGMDKSTMDKIFEPFFTTKGRGKGTGLGLATVYGIVKQNAGFINAYSEPGHGSTFKIYLPRHEGLSGQEPKAAPEPQDLSGHETILVVEDEIEHLRIVKLMLERYGYQVLAAPSPGEALLAAKTHTGKIHFLLTDLIMPEMNGRDLSKEITSLYPDMMCLYMSGYTNNVIVQHDILDQGVHFIEKPFSMHNLAVKVREVLDAN